MIHASREARQMLHNNHVDDVTHLSDRLFTLMFEQRSSGEQDKLATTAFSLPDEVPEMLTAKGGYHVHLACALIHRNRSTSPRKPYILNVRIRRILRAFRGICFITLQTPASVYTDRAQICLNLQTWSMMTGLSTFVSVKRENVTF